MVRLDCVVYYKIVTPRESHYNMQDIRHSVEELALSTVRAVCGHYTLQELLEKRAEVVQNIEDYVETIIYDWGIEIENCNIKDITMSNDIQSTLSSAAKEKRLAEGKIISAQSDLMSAKLMREAADLMSSDAAMQIRYLETVKKVSNNSKVILLGEDEDN